MGRTNGTTNPKKEKIERSVRRYSLILKLAIATPTNFRRSK